MTAGSRWGWRQTLDGEVGMVGMGGDARGQHRTGPRRLGASIVALLTTGSALAGGGLLTVAGSGDAVAAAAAPAASTSPGPVFQAGFESGTDGFTGYPGTVRARRTTGGSSGAWSLSVSGLTGYGQGARVTLPAGLPAGYYGAYASVRLASGQAQDVSITLGPAVQALQTGIVRTSTAAWSRATSFFSLAAGTTGPVVLQVAPVAHCGDAPAVPLPYRLDDVQVSYFGTVPVPMPLLPVPSCPLSGTTSPTPTTPVPTSTSPSPTVPAFPCQVFYQVVSQWPGGFQASLSLQNRTQQPWPSWRLHLAYDGTVQVQSLWGGTAHQDGAVVTVDSSPGAPPRAPGASTSLGLVASWSGTGRPPLPGGVRVNDGVCLVATPV